VRQERQLVAGSVSRFEVDIKNWGPQAVREISVEFRIGQGQPLIEIIPELNADSTATVVFQHVFPRRSPLGTPIYTSLNQDDDALGWMPSNTEDGLEFTDVPVEVTLTL